LHAALLRFFPPISPSPPLSSRGFGVLNITKYTIKRGENSAGELMKGLIRTVISPDFNDARI